MKKKVLVASFMAIACSLYGEDLYLLEKVEATSKTAGGVAFETDSKDNVNSQGFAKEAIELYSGPVGMSALKVVGMSPSVDYQPAEVFGSNETSFHDPLRIRGKSQSGPGGVYMLESMPISGNPGGGKTMFDMENFSGIDLYKGYAPVNKNLGFSNLVGKVDLIVNRPKKESEATFSQTVGVDNTLRSFLRMDTGQIGDIALFGSASKTSGDKWKGEGELDRTNLMLGATYKPNDNFKTEFFVIHNKDEHHNYYGLSYNEAKDLEKYYKKEWNPTPAGGSGNYYDWNKQSFTDTVLAANVEYRFSNDSILRLKPYYSNDEGTYWFANDAKTRVIEWLVDHNRYGATLEYEVPFSDEFNMKAGYWHGKQQPPGPPSSRRLYTINASGQLQYAGWNILAKNDYHEFNSPFLEFSGDIDRFSYSVGVRYLDFKLARLQSYTNGTNASTSQDYDTAIAQGTLDSWASVNEKTFKEWLPSIYFGYKPDKSAEFYFDYAKSYGYDVNLFPTYLASRATLVGKNVTLQQLWDKQQLEISHNFDIGLKYKIGDIVYNPNIFFTKVSGKQASVYDAQYDVSYPSNSMDAISYGAEFAVSGPIGNSVEFLTGLFYNRYYYEDNFKATSTSTASIKGNQVPDAPMQGFKGSITYKAGGWKFTPIVKYTASRYGNADHTQEIPAFTIVDFDVDYKLPKIMGFKESDLRLSITNVFNKHYISSIVTPDNALSADTTQPTYIAGAPIGAYLTVMLKF